MINDHHLDLQTGQSPLKRRVYPHGLHLMADQVIDGTHLRKNHCWLDKPRAVDRPKVWSNLMGRMLQLREWERWLALESVCDLL